MSSISDEALQTCSEAKRWKVNTSLVSVCFQQLFFTPQAPRATRLACHNFWGPSADETYIDRSLFCFYLTTCSRTTEATISKTIKSLLLQPIITLLSIQKSTAIHISIQLFPSANPNILIRLLPYGVISWFWLPKFWPGDSSDFESATVTKPAHLSAGRHGWVITYFPDYNERVSNSGDLSALRPAEIKIRSILSTHSAEYKLTCPLFVHRTVAGGIFMKHTKYLAKWSSP